MAIVEKNVTISGGINIHYLEDGMRGNRDVLLLHGGIGDAKFHWMNILPELEEDYRLIAPDLPGFGKSDPLPVLSYDSLIQWIEALYEALHIDQAVIIGNSVGALLARLFAAAHPLNVPALILINGGILPSKPGAMAIVLAKTPIVNNIVMGMLSRQGLASREALNWVFDKNEDETVLSDAMVAQAKASAPGLAKIMKMQIISSIPESRLPMLPTLLLWGEKDEIAPISAAKKIQAAIPGAELIPIANTKHAPHIEVPEVVSFQIYQFLKQMGTPPSADLPGVSYLGNN